MEIIKNKKIWGGLILALILLGLITVFAIIPENKVLTTESETPLTTSCSQNCDFCKNGTGECTCKETCQSTCKGSNNCKSNLKSGCGCKN